MDLPGPRLFNHLDTEPFGDRVDIVDA